MIGFNINDDTVNAAIQEEQEISNSEEEVPIYREINKQTFKDESSPDLINYKNMEHDKLVRKYRSLYNDCAPSRKIVEQLNTILYKAEIDQFDQEAYLVSEGLMTFFLNYLINFQRLVKTEDKIDLLTYFLVYSAKDIIPLKTQIYNPLITDIKQYQSAHFQLLQPSIEEFKQKIKLDQFSEYKYVALVIKGNSKWFLNLFDLRFKEAYFFDQAYDAKSEIKHYDKFFEDLVYDELRLDVKRQVIHGITANIDHPSDCGHLMFYTLYKLLISKKQIDVNSDFLSPNDISRAKTRCTWLILVQMNMERDKKEDRREIKRVSQSSLQKSQKKYLSLQDQQKELEKKNRAKKNEVRLKQREELLFNRMLDMPIQVEPQIQEEDLELIKRQKLLKKLAVFNLRPKAIQLINQQDSWLVAKKFSEPDHFYNFIPQRPIDTRAKIRDFRAQVQLNQFHYTAEYKVPTSKKYFPIIQLPQPQSMQISMEMQHQKCSSNNKSQEDIFFQPQKRVQRVKRDFHSLDMQPQKNQRYFNSQDLNQNYYLNPFKPSSKELQKRWHYAQNQQKHQPTQQILGRNQILPQFIYPSE